MHLGLVAEGPSDLMLFEAVALQLQPNLKVLRIQPEATLGPSGAGWKAVRAWCREFGSDLTKFMGADSADPLDRLLIHVDCSMAHNVGAARPCPPGADTALELQGVVLRSWLGLSVKPHWLHIATPSSSSDTWLAAVLAPPDESAHIECLPPADIERELIARKLFRSRNGRAVKSGRRYEPLIRKVAADLSKLRTACPIADLLCSELAE